MLGVAAMVIGALNLLNPVGFVLIIAGLALAADVLKAVSVIGTQLRQAGKKLAEFMRLSV